MKQIGSLFDKYRKTLRPPQASVEKEMVDCLKEVTGLEIDQKMITYKTGSKTIQIQAPSILKTEIMKQRGVLLNEIKKRIGSQNAPTQLL